MTMLRAFSVPIAPQGTSAVTTLPSRHHSSDCTAIDYRTGARAAPFGERLATERIQFAEPSTVFNRPAAMRRYVLPRTAESAFPVVESVVAAIIRLLADADQALTFDRAVVKLCIDQATTLLRADYARIVAAERHPLVPSSRSGLTSWQIATVERYVERNLQAAIPISALAAACRLSASYFAAAFKRSMGEPPHVYLTRKRVARAQELMLATDRPLAHIAQDCGFCDQAHFSRIFRQSTGLPPKTWRRRWSPVPAPDPRARNAAAVARA